MRSNQFILHNKECIRGLQDEIDDSTIDTVVTSPPYNLGIKYKSYSDDAPRQEYLVWMEKWIIEIKRVLKSDGSLFLNIGSKPTDPWVPFEVATMIKNHLTLQNVIHWIKSIYIEDNSYNEEIKINVGHYKPINSDRFLNDTHEYIFHFSKKGQVKLDRLALGVPYKDNSNISRWKKSKRCRGNNWYIPYKTIQSRKKERPHPATYPPKLAEMCIKLHGIKQDMTVLDPFMGLGNTALACKDLNVMFIGFELDEYYFSQAEQRLSEPPKKAIADQQLPF